MKKAFQLIDDNFFQHSWKLTDNIEGMQVAFTESMSIADCGLSCDTFNIIYLRNTEKLALADLQQAKQHFESKGFAYTLWVEESQLDTKAKELLTSAGMEVTNREPGMLLDLLSFSPIDTNSFSHIKKVTTPEEIIHFAQIVAQNWQPPDQNLVNYYIKATPAILSSNSPSHFFIYYLSGKPVAGVELFVSDFETAGIFGLSTLVDYRGQGIGSTLFTYVLNKAKRQGCAQVVLQASEDGIGIYKKLGFSTETHFYEWH
jgi:ribosomal protein S18 acetylase RimI-like enzyme